MTTSKASVALLQRVAEVALQSVEDERCYIATTPASTPILAEHLEVLADPAKYTNSAALLKAAVQLSKIIDLVQDGRPVFDWQRIDQEFLSDVYQSVVGNVGFAKAQLSGDALADFEAAQTKLFDDPPFDRTPAYEQFTQLGSQVSQARITIFELQQQRTAAPEAERQALDERIAALTEALKLQTDLLAALDAEHGFSAARRIYDSAQVVRFPASYQNAAELLATTLLSIDDGTETHVRALFAPARLVAENWTTVKVNRADIAAAPTSHPLLPPPPSGDKVSALDDAVIDSVELDIQVVTVERPWLWDGLFTNRMWRWLSTDEPLSDGGSPPTGKVPAYTVGVVVARNLKINGQQKLADAATAASTPLLRLATFDLATPQILKAGQTLRLATTRPALDHLHLRARALPLRPDAPEGPAVLLARPGTGLAGARLAALPARLLAAPQPARGLVRGAGGEPVADASVTATAVEGAARLVKTTAVDGSVSLDLGTAGTYDVAVTHPSYAPATQRVQLTPGASFEIRLDSRFAVADLVAQPVLATLAASVRPGLVRDHRLREVAVREHRLPRVDDLPIRPRPDIPRRPPAVRHTLRVTVTRQHADQTTSAMDAPVRVEVRDSAGATVQVTTVAAGADAALALPAGAYEVWAYCEVYDGVGPANQTVHLGADQTVAFRFRPRTILQSTDTYLMCYLVRRTPKSPDPDPAARF